MKKIHYLNLTNGIEYCKWIDNYRFIRIQSSHCESKAWNKLLMDLDNDFLMNIAIGNECIVHDASQKKLLSRALFQGIPFILFALNYLWYGEVYPTEVRGQDSTNYFEHVCKNLNEDTKKHIRYFKKFVCTDEISVVARCKHTDHDGDYNYFYRLIKENVS